MISPQSRDVIRQCRSIPGFDDLLRELKRPPPKSWKAGVKAEEWIYDSGRVDENLHILRELGLNI